MAFIVHEPKNCHQKGTALKHVAMRVRQDMADRYHIEKKDNISVTFRFGDPLLKKLGWRISQHIKILHGTGENAGQILFRPLNPSGS